MPVNLITSISPVLTACVAILSSLALIRVLVTDGSRTALARARKLAGILADPLTFLRVSKTLMRSESRSIFQAEPRLIFKYLGPYIAAHLSRDERASILIGHYAFLDDVVGKDFLESIVDSRLELWRHAVGENVYRIVLTFPRTTHDEGDLALIFEADGVDIYTLAFAIGPASLCGAYTRHGLYIARVQGKTKGLPLIRRATKHCVDVSPAWMLLAATEGIASALNIRHMFGVAADNQVSADKVLEPGHLVRAYDDFWVAAGGLKLDFDVYHMTVPAELKPIGHIQRDHRRRALRKRGFRSNLTQQVCAAFRHLALGGLTVPLTEGGNPARLLD